MRRTDKLHIAAPCVQAGLRLRGFDLAASASRLRLRGFGFEASAWSFRAQNRQPLNSLAVTVWICRVLTLLPSRSRRHLNLVVILNSSLSRCRRDFIFFAISVS